MGGGRPPRRRRWSANVLEPRSAARNDVSPAAAAVPTSRSSARSPGVPDAACWSRGQLVDQGPEFVASHQDLDRDQGRPVDLGGDPALADRRGFATIRARVGPSHPRCVTSVDVDQDRRDSVEGQASAIDVLFQSPLSFGGRHRRDRPRLLDPVRRSDFCNRSARLSPDPIVVDERGDRPGKPLSLIQRAI